MRTIETLLGQPFMQTLGWALIHFLWQGTLVAILYGVARRLLKDRAADVRYLMACGALVLLLALPVASVYVIARTATGPSALAPHARLNTLRLAAPPERLRDSSTERMTATADERLAMVPQELPSSLARRGFRDFSGILPWLVCAWLVGALLLSLKFMGGWALTRRLKGQQANPLSERWQDSVARLSRRLQLSKAVRVCESVLVEVPTVIGWLRPLVLVPAGMLTGLPAQQIEALIAHELAHVRRHDYLINLLQTMIETLLFYHPAVWWISRQVRIEREHCCDDMAVAACDGDVLLYARALTGLEQLRGTRPGQLALAASGGSLLGRVRRLLEGPRPASPRASSWLAGVMALIAVFAVVAGVQGFLLGRVHAHSNLSGASNHTKPGSRQAAVTIVSVPSIRVWREPAGSLEETTRRMLKSLMANNVPAVGFVSEAVLTHGPERQGRINLLRLWLDAGMELGNQTYSHPSLYNTAPAEFQRNVLNGERVLRPLMKERGKELRYFSYPFLNTGPNREVKAAFERFLSEHGYTVAPVTIDSMDWLFGKVYEEAKQSGDREMMQRVAAEYVPYMERMMEFYEQLSTDVVGYEVPQVLMLTASQLLADRMDEMLAMLKRRGYSFISLEQALQDPAYRQAETYTGPVGISWLQRWAITKGQGFRKEPPLPTFMQQFDNRAASASDFKTEE